MVETFEWDFEQKGLVTPLNEWVLCVRDQSKKTISNWFTSVLSNFWKNIDFRKWLHTDMTQFCKLGTGRQMYSSTILLLTILYSSKFYHQYMQIKSLIDKLVKLGNLLRPLTAFKQIIWAEDKTKMLSKSYDALLNEAVIIYKAKTCWEKDLGVAFTDQHWKKIKVV